MKTLLMKDDDEDAPQDSNTSRKNYSQALALVNDSIHGNRSNNEDETTSRSVRRKGSQSAPIQEVSSRKTILAFEVHPCLLLDDEVLHLHEQEDGSSSSSGDIGADRAAGLSRIGQQSEALLLEDEDSERLPSLQGDAASSAVRMACLHDLFNLDD